jgi:hypothetical protein
VIAEGIDRNFAHFRILSGGVVLSDERLDLITQALINCALAGYCS